ncbi:hypothetical protein F5Y04DRAFT_248080 [Hypomontagnella monticulosa]|nr:hypothetical protein F5Y04DRAFT_248080 [Hypomontagnella monticulosa]
MASTQESQKVQLSLNLSTVPPYTISIHDAYPSKPLKLIASIRQTASPFPDRPVTILTKYSCLDTSQGDDAFFIRAMASPQITSPSPNCPAPELPLRPVGKHVTTIRVSGHPNLLKRGDDGFTFVTIPPVGQGSADVDFDLPPSRLLERLGDENESLEDKMSRFLRPGDTYRIVPSDLNIRWWAFGSLENPNTKVSRWTFPNDLPLVREPGDDETDEVARKLKDLVDLHDVNHLNSRSAVEGEERPVVRKMRQEGWVFGEPEAGLKMTVENEGKGGEFTIVG